MKKILTVTIIFVILVMMAVTVNAATSSDLANTLYKKGSKYGVTESDKVRIERYIADSNITDAEANEIIAKVDEAVAIMEEAGVTSYNDLTDKQKSELKSIANEVASVAGLTLKFGTNKVEIYKGNKLVETATKTNGKLQYTGNNSTVLVVTSISLAIIALVAVAKKRSSLEG